MRYLVVNANAVLNANDVVHANTGVNAIAVVNDINRDISFCGFNKLSVNNCVYCYLVFLWNERNTYFSGEPKLL